MLKLLWHVMAMIGSLVCGTILLAIAMTLLGFLGQGLFVVLLLVLVVLAMHSIRGAPPLKRHNRRS